jgi:predicted Zn-dependent peptidase
MNINISNPILKNIQNQNVLLINNNSNKYLIQCYILSDMKIEKNYIGIDHLLEHILVDSYNNCKNNCQEYLRNLGIKVNASVFNNLIKYYVYGFKDKFDIMLNYIIEITKNPKFNKTIINKEKKAIINELTILINKNNYLPNKLNNKFIFKNNKLKYFTDCELQIENLKNLDYNNIYDYYINNYKNVFYVITGNINEEILNKLDNKLSNYKNLSINNNFKINLNNIFSYKKKIIYLNNNKLTNSEVWFSFPCNYKLNDNKEIYLKIIKIYLRDILLKELRENKKYVYSIIINEYAFLYGSYIKINFSCSNKNLEESVKITIDIINKLKNKLINKNLIKSISDLFLLDFDKNINNIFNYSYYYVIQYYFNSYINNKILTIDEFKKEISKNNYSLIKEIINEIFNFENCILIYINKNNKLNHNIF